ncbi:hypothetical protein DFAR_850026 [Desulfarculales bacterium]
MAKRFEYTIRLGALTLVTGDVGRGKATALHWTASRRHPPEYQTTWVTVSKDSILELYRQVCGELAVDTARFSRAVLTKSAPENRSWKSLRTAKKSRPHHR